MIVINWGNPSTIKWDEVSVKNETVADVANMVNSNIDTTKELFEAVVSEMDRRTMFEHDKFCCTGTLFEKLSGRIDKLFRKNRGTKLGLILAVGAGIAYVIFNEKEKNTLKIKALELQNQFDAITGGVVSGFEDEGNAIPPTNERTTK